MNYDTQNTQSRISIDFILYYIQNLLFTPKYLSETTSYRIDKYTIPCNFSYKIITFSAYYCKM